jgi:hypothetical protein
MADQVSPRYASSVGQREEPSGLAVGFILFAGMLMLMVGIFQALAGVVGIVNDNFYLITRDYVFRFSTNTWGWIHLIIGVVVALAGAAVLSGKMWGRVIGIIVALLSAVAAFMFIPAYPFWALLLIALDVFVVWALAAHGREVAE